MRVQDSDGHDADCFIVACFLHSCFLSLLLIAAALWKIKHKYDSYRRRQVSADLCTHFHPLFVVFLGGEGISFLTFLWLWVNDINKPAFQQNSPLDSCEWMMSLNQQVIKTVALTLARHSFDNRGSSFAMTSSWRLVSSGAGITGWKDNHI